MGFYFRNGYAAPEIIWKPSGRMTPNYPTETPPNKTRRFIIIFYTLSASGSQKKKKKEDGLSGSAVSVCETYKQTVKMVFYMEVTWLPRQ